MVQRLSNAVMPLPTATPASTSLRLEILRTAPLNSWLALSEDESEIVASGKSFVEVDRIATQSGKKYFLTKTPDSWVPRVLNSV